MLAPNHEKFILLFKELEDPREDERLIYPLEEVIFLALAAVLAGAESWNAILRYGDAKLNLLKKFLPYKNAIPSKTTLMRVFSLLDKQKFEAWLTCWGSSLITDFSTEQIAIDGKALRGARKNYKEKNPLYLLNAFATKNGLVIGQKTIDDKTNEITAIPELLDNLTIKDSLVSIDAIGCQKKIIEKLIEKKADYFLALKANQPSLYGDVLTYFTNAKNTAKDMFHQTIDKGHGRIEVRRCISTDKIEWLKKRHPGWLALNSICMVESERHIGENISVERRYYISSTLGNSVKHLDYSRNHWSIENNLHWVLDVQLKEDDSHVRVENAAENMGTIRKMIINLIKKYKKRTNDKNSISTLRNVSGWEDRIAEDILTGLTGNHCVMT